MAHLGTTGCVSAPRPVPLWSRGDPRLVVRSWQTESQGNDAARPLTLKRSGAVRARHSTADAAQRSRSAGPEGDGAARPPTPRRAVAIRLPHSTSDATQRGRAVLARARAAG